MCVVFCFCFGQDAVLVHCCARLAAELHAGVCFSSFINNFVTQLCFSTTSHNYGNLKSHWETRGSRGGTWLFLSISLRQIRTFDHTKAVCLPSQWSLSSPSIKRDREKKRKNLQSAHKQTPTTSRHLPAACDADAVCGAAQARAGGGSASTRSSISSPRGDSSSPTWAAVRAASHITRRHTSAVVFCPSLPHRWWRLILCCFCLFVFSKNLCAFKEKQTQKEPLKKNKDKLQTNLSELQWKGKRQHFKEYCI